MTENSSTTLQIVIDQFRNISPELYKALIFKQDGEIVASIEDSIKQDQTQKIASSFEQIARESVVIGGLETLTIQDPNNQFELTSVNNRYLVTVASRAADEKMIKALTNVIVPTILKLLNPVDSTTAKQKPLEEEPASKEPDPEPYEPEEPVPTENPARALEVPAEPAIPKAPVNQLLVERIRGLLVPSDAVRVDDDLVSKWRDLYSGREITRLTIETLEGRSVKIKFKPMREAEANLKGIIQIPERVLHFLGTGEGKLVTVKPVVATLME